MIAQRNKLLLYPHLGLGDLFICNGLVREICSKTTNEDFTIVVKPDSFQTISFMLKDVINLKVVSLCSGNFSTPESRIEVEQYASIKKMQILKIGHELMPQDVNFDKAFYKQFNLDFKKRWSSFHVSRNEKSEKALLEKLDIKGPYLFVHSDEPRGMKIERMIDSGVRIIRAKTSLSENMFDYLSLIEGAEEIHCIESSFMFMIDSFPIDKPLFAHRYARSYPARNTPTLRLPWKILT